MYSGVDEREFDANIFFGVVYYQRLRHMVSDKFQVRTMGPIDILTHQPVNERKRAGGHTIWRDGERLITGSWQLVPIAR